MHEFGPKPACPWCFCHALSLVLISALVASVPFVALVTVNCTELKRTVKVVVTQ